MTLYFACSHDLFHSKLLYSIHFSSLTMLNMLNLFSQSYTNTKSKTENRLLPSLFLSYFMSHWHETSKHLTFPNWYVGYIPHRMTAHTFSWFYCYGFQLTYPTVDHHLVWNLRFNISQVTFETFYYQYLLHKFPNNVSGWAIFLFYFHSL